MQALKKYTPFLASALLMYVVLYIIYPHYQFYIDPDGTAYLTIAKRYATGDFSTAINGYWSPWACWLTALLIKGGLSAIPASVVINTLGATGFLYISQSFFLRFNIITKLQWLLNTTLALFLCYAIFWQSFDDLWECFFLLCSLRLMIADRFITRPWLWIACGLIGALAYFAKAYSFPFFILNTLCCTYFLAKGNKLQWLKVSAVCIFFMLFGAHFWIMRLQEKYGIWTTATAGSLNMSWYLIGHPHWKAGVYLLLPPAYPGSPSYWEDPYLANGATPHFWDSWHLFGLQLLRIGLNVYKFIVSSLQLSVLFPVIIIIAARQFLQRNTQPLFTGAMQIVGLSFLLFPLGYLLINYESRYLWYMLPLGMVMGAFVLQNMYSIKWRNILSIVLPITLLIYPALCMAKMYNEGATEYNAATQLKQLNISGSFTSTAKPGTETQRMQRLAYFSGNQFYSLSTIKYSPADVLAEAQKKHLNYFIIYNIADTACIHNIPELTKGDIPGLNVFLVTPH